MQSVKHKAVALLARREHSRRELTDKLRQKGYNTDEIEACCDELEAKTYLSDERFTLAFVKDRIQKGHGPLKIKAALLSKGVHQSLIEQCELWQDNDWQALAYQVASKKLLLLEDEPLTVKRKLNQFLQQRGFEYSHIEYVLSHCHINQTENELSLKDHENP